MSASSQRKTGIEWPHAGAAFRIERARCCLRGNRIARTIAGIGAVFLLGGCSNDAYSALDPLGPEATNIADQWWLLFWLGLVVFVVVMLLLGYAIIRASRQTTPDARPPISERTFFIVAGLVIPSLIIAVVLADSVFTGRAVVSQDDDPAVTIEVIGHQYWWEIRYPDHDVVTANEIHIPEGEMVELHLTSADVIHSFWVPQIAGKRDLNPGGVNIIQIEAGEAREYWGQCAEFCGVQHALMGMLVIAEPMDEFQQWIQDHQAPATEPDSEQLQTGMEVYFDAGCAMCHSIDGITEPGSTDNPGPDLTHFGSRRTLASGIEENSFGNLAAWVTDPHQLKPGVKMPATPLESEELTALVEFLLSLE